jgi:hypothetical protein
MKPDQQYYPDIDKLKEQIADLWAFIEWLKIYRYQGYEISTKIQLLEHKWRKP